MSWDEYRRMREEEIRQLEEEAAKAGRWRNFWLVVALMFLTGVVIYIIIN